MMSRNDPYRRENRPQDYDRGAPPRGRFPEIRFLKLVFEAVVPWIILGVVGVAVVRLAVSTWNTIPVVHAALWPGWAVGLAAAYLGTVIVRALR